jgi:SAM-dependent methyltransferase
VTSSDVDPSSAVFFDSKYLERADPWGFSSDSYELDRYDVLVSHVDPSRHRHVFEPGCSIGVLTEMLGRLCTTVDAADLSERAVQLARQRCADLANVSIRVGDLLPLPGAHYDLIMFSEVGYYRSVADLEPVVGELIGRVAPGGRLIAGHWIGTSPDHRSHGHDVHDLLSRMLTDWRLAHHCVHHDAVHDGYRLDIWDRR